jgi:nicotinate-nucleotide adenylyltransferase
VRIGIFGGSFDPVHLGHLIVAEECRDQSRLDEVLFVPAARPPHKQDTPLTSFQARVEMLELALAGQPAFKIEQLEKDRPGPSYTADTLEELRSRQAGAEFFLILGADCLPDLPHWHEPRRIIELATLLAVDRPGTGSWSDKDLQSALGLSPALSLRLQRVDSPLIAISSSEIRRRIPEKRSIRYLVPRAVECYIQTHGLYEAGG